jgi:hypothetical protein
MDLLFCLRIAGRPVGFSGARPLLRTINGALGGQKSGVNPGSFQQFGVALGLEWKPRKRWSTGISYDLTRRDGSSTSDSYLQNLVSFNLNYLF